MLRICGIVHPSFQAFAHVLIGYLVGAGTRNIFLSMGHDWLYFKLFGIISILELVCFLLKVGH